MELYSQDGSGKYAALGLSEDPRMGDDLVLSCAEVSGKTLRRQIFILVMLNCKFFEIVFYSRLVARCSLALAGTVVVLIRCRRLGEDSSKTCKWKIGENNCVAIMKVKVKKGDTGRPHQVLLTWSRRSTKRKLAKIIVEQL